MKVLLMTGGSGTRLWPKSRKSMPKQFMSLGNHQTLFQQTLVRVRSLVPATSMYAVTPPEYLHHIRRQAPDMSASQIIVEPVQHSTTASLGYAMAWLMREGLEPDDVIVVLPTDAYVGDDSKYLSSLRQAIEIASQTQGIVTIGIQPTYPATGYGYIQRGQNGRVKRFVEKPDYERAEEYIDSGDYFWNAGMFVWKASTIWGLFSKLRPADYQTLQEIGELLELSTRSKRYHKSKSKRTPRLRHGAMVESSARRLDPLEAIAEKYQQLPKQSFEFTIVEKAPEIYAVPGDFDWTDLGTWSVLLDKLGPESTSKNVVAMDSEGCLVDSHSGLVGLLGVKDLIVVNTEDTVFICRRDRDQDVKQFRKLLEERGYGDYL